MGGDDEGWEVIGDWGMCGRGVDGIDGSHKLR